MIKLALDNQVSPSKARALKKHGFDVVVFARDRADEDWVSEAIGKEVDAIVSPDLDVPNLLDAYNSDIVWIEYKSHVKNPFNFLMQQLKVVKNYLNSREELKRINSRHRTKK